MKRSHIGLACAVAAVALAFGLLSAPLAARAEPADSRQLAPAVALQDANGRPVAIQNYRGHVVMLDFWETWCGGCKTEIPWYIEFQKKYGRDGLTVVGVALDDTGWKTVKPYMAAHPFDYEIVMGKLPDLARAFHLVSLPKTLLIDRHGRIAAAHTGVVDRAAWESKIEQLLREK